MKYEIRVEVRIVPTDPRTGYVEHGLTLSETQTIELTTLAEAAAILVKLHEFFEVMRKKGGAS